MKLPQQVIFSKDLQDNCFQNAMRWPLWMAQCFGFFPTAVENPPKFTWLSWRMVYFLFTLALLLQELIKLLILWASETWTFLSIDIRLLFINGVLRCILMLKTAVDWRDFANKWNALESKMRNYKGCGNLKKKLLTISCTIMLMGAMEHTLINAHILTKKMVKAANISEGFKSYFADSYPATFKFTKYSPLLGIMNEMAYVQAVFIWNYADVLIMLTGTALNFKAKQISIRVQTLIDIKSADLASWRRVRQDYTRLVDLCNYTNSKMSLSIVISFTVNLYFMMEQIFKNIKPLDGVVQKSYFAISMTLLLTRTVCVVIFCGSVYSEYMEICYIIHSVSSTAYNREVERFIETLETCELVLTGYNLFRLTKGTIFKIAETIVSYELILLQFNPTWTDQ